MSVVLRTLALAALFLAICLHAQENSSSPPPESLRIARGDLLRVSVLREPDLNQTVRVRDSGEVSLPLIGSIQIAGLSAAEAAAAISRKYLDGQFLRHPDVSVFIAEYATQSVSVLGQVVKPGEVRIPTARSLIDVLAMAGGFTDIADRHISIERGDASHNQVDVFLSNHPEDAFNADLLIYPGDKILVPKAGIVYVLGDVGRPGGYVMQNDSRMTVLQAIAMAVGINKTASVGQARLIRNENGKYTERPLPLKDIERGRAPDELLQPNDVLFIPFSFGKNIVMGTNAIVASTTSALIYAGR